jgi:hypothetical protein
MLPVIQVVEPGISRLRGSPISTPFIIIYISRLSSFIRRSLQPHTLHLKFLLYTASNRNEYQESFLGVKTAGA